MTVDLQKFATKIASQFRRQNLDSQTVNDFCQYSLQIINQGKLLDQGADRTDEFLQNVVPKVANGISSALGMNKAKLQLSIQIMKSLFQLSLWAMLNGNEKLIDSLLIITDTTSSFYSKNLPTQPSLVSDLFHDFISSQFYEQLNDKLSNFDQLPASTFFSIYAFLFQFTSSGNPENEDYQGPYLTYPMLFNGLVETLEDEAFQKCPSKTLVVILNSLFKMHQYPDVEDLISTFLIILSRSAKCDNFDKQLTALTKLNYYAKSTNPTIISFFDEWKEETDVVSALIQMDLHFEILRASQDLIRKVIKDEEVYDFLIKSENSYITQRHFEFQLISQIMSDRFDGNMIIDFISELEQNSVELEFLCVLMVQLFVSQKEELYETCEELIDCIFSIGQENPNDLTPSMILFFKELNEIDVQKNNPNITKWRVKVLGRYIQTLTWNEFNDRTCTFIAEQLEILRDVALRQPQTTPFDEILLILEDTLGKTQQRYLETKNVTEAIIRLFYILVLFRAIKFIVGDANHIRVREPANYEYFDFAVSALMYTNDSSIADIAIELFSRFFSQSAFFAESINILYNSCKDNLALDIDQKARYRILKLIYKTLIDLEGDYELIDFESRRRNHRNDMKGKMKVTVRYVETEFEIYSRSNAYAFELINRIAMRLKATPNMIQVTDSSKSAIDPNGYVCNLGQPLEVICLDNYSQQNYSSASFALWNRSFTTVLLQTLDSSPCPELTHITKKLLSFLPCDDKIMHATVDQYLQMINDAAKSDEKFSYLLHCINHFTPTIKKEIGEKLKNIWQVIREKTTCLPAIFEFFLCLLNEENQGDYAMFIGGRVFRAFYLHDKKAYKIGMELFNQTLHKYINVNDVKLLFAMLTHCEDDEWPYLQEMFKLFQAKEAIFSRCIDDIGENKLKNKFVIKLLAMYAKDVMGSGDNIESFLNTIDSLENCDLEQLIDVMNIVSNLSNVRSHQYFQDNQKTLNMMINLAFKKGSLDAEDMILNFYKQFENTMQSQATSNTLRQFFDQKYDVWNYRSKDNLQIKKTVGIKNLHATCYMNSIFQVLNRIPEFLNNLFASNDPKVQNLQWILGSLQKSTRKFIDPSKFINEWDSGWDHQRIDPKVEQDALEFFQYLMEDCPPEAQDIFKGEEIISYAGDENYSKEVTEPFYSISVNVKDYPNLVQSINSLVEPETITDFDDGQGNKISASRTTKITKCPKVLVIRLHRFEYNVNLQRNVKVNKRFEFPEHLNLLPLMKDENKNAFYSLHSIVCHYGNPQENGHYYTLVRDSKEYKYPDILSTNEDKWIQISDIDISDLPNGYKEESFGGRMKDPNEFHDPGSAYLLFYVLDEFIQSNLKESPIEVKLGDDLMNTINKENEQFGIIQTLFSVKLAEFLQQTPLKDANIYYLYNIMMHGSVELRDYINEITKSIDLSSAVNYTDTNFNSFFSIFERCTVPELMDPFTQFACKIMEKKESLQILRRIVESLSMDLPQRAIKPLLMLVYSYLNVNGPPEEPIDIINKLVNFFEAFMKSNKANIKIDNIILSLAKLLEFGKTNRERLINSSNLNPIAEHFDFIPEHLENRQSLNQLVEQAVKYGLMEIKYFFDLKDINDKRLANVFNETNYKLIGSKYPDKINDILIIVQDTWDKERLEKFALSMFPKGILDKEDQPFVIFFLSNGKYKDPQMLLSVIESSGSLNVDVLEKIVSVSSLQNQDTYQYILRNIMETKDEDDLLSLIRMVQYLVNEANVNEIFQAIFSKVVDQSCLIPRFDAFVESTKYLLKKEGYKEIRDSSTFKDYKEIFKISENSFKQFMERVNAAPQNN